MARIKGTAAAASAAGLALLLALTGCMGVGAPAAGGQSDATSANQASGGSAGSGASASDNSSKDGKSAKDSVSAAGGYDSPEEVAAAVQDDLNAYVQNSGPDEYVNGFGEDLIKSMYQPTIDAMVKHVAEMYPDEDVTEETIAHEFAHKSLGAVSFKFGKGFFDEFEDGKPFRVTAEPYQSEDSKDTMIDISQDRLDGYGVDATVKDAQSLKVTLDMSSFSMSWAFSDDEVNNNLEEFRLVVVQLDNGRWYADSWASFPFDPYNPLVKDE